MNITPVEFVVIGAAVAAVLMAGSSHIRTNLWFYTVQTLLIALASALTAHARADAGLYLIAAAIAVLKGIGVPAFLSYIINRLKISSDSGMIVPAPLAMHGSILLMGVAYVCTASLPVTPDGGHGWPGTTAAVSLLFTGIVLMLTRKVAVNQIIGFLVIENGIYTFALMQTHDMPMIVEMGILLDVLVGVMIAGLLVFSIQKSFEHVDVARLTELKD
jgi:hydrogenase-4 component E